MSQINKKHFIKDRKEEDSMIVASKKYVKSKERNWEYTPYEVSKEEVKNK